jgi:hypothetical protein
VFTRVEFESETGREPLTRIAIAAKPEDGTHALKALKIRLVSAIGRSLREPLVHFLVAGAVLLVLSAFFGRFPALAGGQNRILVTAATIRQLRDVWAAQWGNPPNPTELQALIDDYVREEIFFREAIASGLDQGDTIMRRHLAQKIEFLAEGKAAAAEPTDAELKQFFEVHASQYLVPPKASFSHVYFSMSKRGASASQAAKDALSRLVSMPMSSAEASALGDRFMLQYEYPLKSQNEIRELFGNDFATAVFGLVPGEWQGPVGSSYGVHLVRVNQRVPERVPEFEEVRTKVALDFNDEQIRSAVDTYYQKLRKRYRVDIDQQSGGAE